MLDAALPPTDKIDLARWLFADLETDDPRDALKQALARERKRVTTGDHDLLSRLQRLDHQLGGGGALMDRLEDLEDQYGSTLDEAARGLDRLLGDNAQGLATTVCAAAPPATRRPSSSAPRSTGSGPPSTTWCWRRSTRRSAPRSS